MSRDWIALLTSFIYVFAAIHAAEGLCLPVAVIDGDLNL